MGDGDVVADVQGGDVTGVEEVRVELRAVFYEELDVDGADADGVVRAGARDGRDRAVAAGRAVVANRVVVRPAICGHVGMGPTIGAGEEQEGGRVEVRA